MKNYPIELEHDSKAYWNENDDPNQCLECRTEIDFDKSYCEPCLKYIERERAKNDIINDCQILIMGLRVTSPNLENRVLDIIKKVKYLE